MSISCTVEPLGGGYVTPTTTTSQSGNPGDAEYHVYETTTVVATPNPGYVFSRFEWRQKREDEYDPTRNYDIEKSSSPTNRTQNFEEVTDYIQKSGSSTEYWTIRTVDYDCKAIFEEATVTGNFYIAGSSGAISAGCAIQVAGQSGSSMSISFPANSTQFLTSTYPEHWTFDHWMSNSYPLGVSGWNSPEYYVRDVTITVPNHSFTVYAYYTEDPKYSCSAYRSRVNGETVRVSRMGTVSVSASSAYSGDLVLWSGTIGHSNFGLIYWEGSSGVRNYESDPSSPTGFSINVTENESWTGYFASKGIVTLDGNAESSVVSPSSITIYNTLSYGAITGLPTPTRTGYTFLGWFTDPEGGTQISDNTVASFTSTTSTLHTETLYAHWEEDQSFDSWIVYNANGGEGAPETEYYDSDIGTIISSTIPTYSGHIFIGWSSSSSSTSVQYLPDSSFYDGIQGEHILYALWIDASGVISNIQQNVTHGENPEGDVSTFTATWTIDSYTPGLLVCTGHIDWEAKNIQSGYEVSKIAFYCGSELKGSEVSSSGTLSGIYWDIQNPPSQAIVSWTQTNRDKLFTVSAESEGGGTATGCTVEILPAHVSSGYYATDEVITLSASEASGWKFVRWEKVQDGTSIEVSTSVYYTIIVSADNSGNYRGIFKNTNELYHVSIEIMPLEARDGVSVSGDGDYHIGDTITFSATGSSDYEFVRWKMKGYSFERTNNPYSWKLTEQDVELTTDWIAEFKETGKYRVLTRVNSSVGTLKKYVESGSTFVETTDINFLPNTTLRLSSELIDSSVKYACTELRNSQNESIKNTHLGYGSGFESGIKYTYNVDADTVWKAIFEKYIVADFYVESDDSSPTYKRHAFPGHEYSFSDTFPTPMKSGYYFKGWYKTKQDETSSENADRVSEDDIVPSNDSEIKLYAHWESLSTKFFVTAEVVPSTIGTMTVSEPANGEYFVVGEICTITFERDSSWTSSLFVFKETDAKQGGIWKTVDLDMSGNYASFIVGENSSWEEDGESEGEKTISLRFYYEDKGVLVTTENVPSSGSLGYIGNLEHASYPRSDFVNVKAFPNTGLGAYVVKWEHKDDSESWQLIGDGHRNTNSVDVQITAETQMIIRVTFGLSGTLTYDLAGGSSTETLMQDYDRDLEFKLKDFVPTKSGYVFIGWGVSSSSTAPSYLPGGSITISEETKTLYAVWYKTPQILTKIRHYDEETKEDYTGTPATVSAQVSNIQMTSTVGALQGTLTWTVTMPTGEGTEGVKFSSIWILDSTDNTIFQSSNETNTSGSTVNFSCDTNLEDDWTFVVVYNTGTKHFAYFNARGGVGAPEPIAFNEGESFIIPDQVPTREGYVFRGWAWGEDATEPTYFPGDTFEGLGADTGFATLGDIFFYAIWGEGISINVVHYNMTTNQISSVPLSFAAVWVESSIEPDGVTYNNIIHWEIEDVKKGFELSKIGTIRFTKGDGFVIATEDSASGSVTYRSMSGGPNETWTATIYYVQNAFVITYDTKGGIPVIGQQTVVSGDVAKISALKPKKQGYRFLGWSEDANSVQPTYLPGQNITITGSMTLYAVYEEESDSSSDESSSSSEDKEYTLYAEPERKGTGTVYPTEVSFNDGDTITLRATAATGYRFAYWTLYGGEGVPDTISAVYTFTATASLDGCTFVAVFSDIEEILPTDLIYYKPTDLLMSYKNTLIWNDDGLKGCGDGSD